jgi:hypothetical protein
MRFTGHIGEENAKRLQRTEASRKAMTLRKLEERTSALQQKVKEKNWEFAECSYMTAQMMITKQNLDDQVNRIIFTGKGTIEELADGFGIDIEEMHCKWKVRQRIDQSER